MTRENKYELCYEVPTANGDWRGKTIRFDGDEKKKENLEKVKKFGYRLVSCEKLYPFSLEKNFHNVDLAYTVAKNRCYDMESGALPWDDETFKARDELHDLVDILNGSFTPIAWLPGKIYAKVRDWTAWAVCYRDEANANKRWNG